MSPMPPGVPCTCEGEAPYPVRGVGPWGPDNPAPIWPEPVEMMVSWSVDDARHPKHPLHCVLKGRYNAPLPEIGDSPKGFSAEMYAVSEYRAKRGECWYNGTFGCRINGPHACSPRRLPGIPCTCGGEGPHVHEPRILEMWKETKATNPKDAIGADKIPFHLWPETATIYGVMGMLDGALKYGRSNYRAIGVRASIYVDAARRHLNAWFEGEENAPDSGVPHLAHALACIAILIDAREAEMLNDDRMVRGGYTDLVERMTPLVRQLKEKHSAKSPKHYTIADSPPVQHIPGIPSASLEDVNRLHKEKP